MVETSWSTKWKTSGRRVLESLHQTRWSSHRCYCCCRCCARLSATSTTAASPGCQLRPVAGSRLPVDSLYWTAKKLPICCRPPLVLLLLLLQGTSWESCSSTSQSDPDRASDATKQDRRRRPRSPLTLQLKQPRREYITICTTDYKSALKQVSESSPSCGETMPQLQEDLLEEHMFRHGGRSGMKTPINTTAIFRPFKANRRGPQKSKHSVQRK